MRRFMFVSLAMAACSSSEAVRSGDRAEAGRSAGGAAAEGGAFAGAGQPGAAGTIGDAGESIGGTSNAGKGGGAGVADAAGQSGMGDAGVGGEGGGPTTAQGGASGSSGDSGHAGMAGSPEPTSEAPTVAVLLDGSTSMFDPRELRWDAIREALLEPVSGVIPSFAAEVRFGLNIFRGDNAPHEEADPLCANITGTDFAFGNETAMGAAYDAVSDEYELGIKWNTPTGHAVRRVTSALTDLAVPDGSRKYIVLITDGNPNTCLSLDPQCGQDLVVKAVQDAYELGIRTLVFGTGDVLQANDGCPSDAPCGAVHLQDVANAGVGLPVAEPPANYRFQTCVVGSVLTAEYATIGGAAAFYTGTTMDEMRAAIRSMMERIVAGEVP